MGMADMPRRLEVISEVRKRGRVLRRLLFFLIFAGVLGVGYMYLAPLMQVEKTPIYSAYTVRRGSIATEKSFSASISVASSETHNNTTKATSIKEIYVSNGQEVKKGDKLMLLDTGETLKAGLDGVVTQMRFDTTDWLWNNVQLIQISDLEHLKVSLSVDEYDVRNVTAGQTCFVTIIPLGITFETKITHVDRVSASSGQVAYYTASAELDVPPNVLPGMTVSVTIPSESRADALLLDMAALAFDEERNPYVLRREGEGYTRVPVTTGLSDGMQVEILTGLQEGEKVWALSGTEEAESAFTLTELYKKIAGEKVVINDMTGGSQSNRSPGQRDRTPGSRQGNPQSSSEAEQQGMVILDGTANGAFPTASPGGLGQPKPQSSPDASRRPRPQASPSVTPQPSAEAADEAAQQDTTATTSPVRREKERKETP